MNPENLIKYAVERVNEQLPNKKKIVFKKNLHIFGPKSKLDSLSIVNLFVEIENQNKKKNKIKINLLNDKLFSNSNRQYTFKDLIMDLNKKNNEKN